MNQDTICAIATAQGGAIGCIRVSGPVSYTHLIPSLATAVTGGVSITLGLTDICTASNTSRPVSYTHLDVYKRQIRNDSGYNPYRLPVFEQVPADSSDKY